MAFAALVPSPYCGDDWWQAYDYPVRLVDQFFGDALEDGDLLPPSYCRGFLLRPRTRAHVDASGTSEVANGADEFRVRLDVGQFRAEELEVKVSGRFVVVHARHDERGDEHGFIAREFRRRYMLPRDCDGDRLTSTLTAEGVLVIRAPKVPPPSPDSERQIVITQE